MALYSHVMQYDDGTVMQFSYVNIDELKNRLNQFNGTDPYALILWALPPGMEYDQAVEAGADWEYIQAAGCAEALTVEICKPGGAQWGVDWVRYVIGHPDGGPAVLDVPIVLSTHSEMRSRSEVFEAAEAAQLFYSYYKTGDIPTGYALRPEQGFTKAGGNITLRDPVQNQR